MADFARILGAFALIVVLLRRRWQLSLVICLVAFLFGASYGLPWSKLGLAALRAALAPRTVSVVTMLYLISLLECGLRRRGLLRRMVGGLSSVLRERKTVMMILPAVVGLLPSAGGAYFSAPLVEEAAGGAGYTARDKTIYNYWFRHVWEFILPLYPATILAASVLHVPFGRFLVVQAPVALAYLIAGVVLSLFLGRGTSEAPDRAAVAETAAAEEEASRLGFLDFLIGVVPIAAVLGPALLFHVDLMLSLGATTALVYVAGRFSWQETWAALRESFRPHHLLVVVGVMVFKAVVELTGAVGRLPAFFDGLGVAPVVVIFALPFLVGMLTGISQAYVGIGFPLVSGLIPAGTAGLPWFAFAFASGFAGVMLSPTHLCLVLTKDYFGADLVDVVKALVVPMAAVVLVSLGLAYL